LAKLYIICGHGAGDPGACAAGQTEADNVRTLAARIKELGGSEVNVLDTGRNWYADAGINKLSISKGSALLELHMDSAVETARGGHVIIKSGYDADDWDKALAAGIAAILPGRAETIVHRNNLANVNRAAARGINYRLLETGFISNEDDRNIFNDRLDDIAHVILASFGIGSHDDIEPSPSAPATDSDGFGGTYRCQVDGLRVRTGPGLSYAQAKDANGNLVCYNKGGEVILDDWFRSADGYIWGRYTGAQSGQLRYVAVGKATGKPEPDDFLVKV